MLRVSCLAVAAVAMVSLSACSQDEPSDPPSIEGSDPGTAESSPSASESEASSAAKFDGDGHESLQGRVAADDAEERAVADAWFAYWRTRANAYGEAKVSADELGKVATGSAASSVVDYVKYLQDNGLHTQGDSLFGVSNIKIQGDVAGLTSCMQNKSIDRHEDGRAAEKLTKHLTFTGVVQRKNGTWVVSEAVKTGEAPCQAR